jgi:hypothetical protein
VPLPKGKAGIEHGMPQSTFYGIYPMYSDIHYLFQLMHTLTKEEVIFLMLEIMAKI